VSDKRWKALKIVLFVGTVLAALKLVFVDFTLDEEYQIVMAYRYLQGDHLFKEMWEPHQTSAFVCAGLMWLFMTVTGSTTGIVLFLRFVALGIQTVLGVAVYRTLSGPLNKNDAFLLALLYFNIMPKNIQSPDFGNMQLWFLTIPILLVMKYYCDKEQKGKDGWYLLLGAGVSLACEVLTYPTCIILFPFFIVYMWRKSGKQRLRDCLILTATCGVCGIIWLVSVFAHVGLEEFAGNVGKLLSVDPTHDVSGMTSAKHSNYIENFQIWAVVFAGIAAVAGAIYGVIYFISKKKGKMIEKKSGWLMFWTLAIVVAELVQIYIWVVMHIGYEYLQVHLLVIYLALAAVWRLAGDGKHIFAWGILGTLVAYAGVMYISDLAMYYTLPHGSLGIVFAVAVIVLAMQKVMKDKARFWILLLVVSLCLVSIGGKGYTLRGGKSENTVLAVSGIMKKGPAAGILADYMCAYIYNRNYEEYADYVQEGDNVLIVANMIMSVGTIGYLFDDVNISHYSVVDPTTYNESLLEYWEQYPEKAPDVIVVDCWYGELKESPDSWIMQYIENDFGYTSVNDGSYVRFYRR